MKAAAKILLERFKDISNDQKIEQLSVQSITEANREAVKLFVLEMITTLKNAGVITDYTPKFTLGSTRLWSDVLGDAVVLGPGETLQDFTSANKIKQSLGDLDVDLEFLVSPVRVLDVLTEAYPDKVVGRLCGGDEVNMLVNMGDYAVQVDLVNITPVSPLTYHQYSSLKDIAVGLRGAFRDVLSRSIVHGAPISTEHIQVLRSIEADKSNEINSICNAKPGETLEIVNRRYSLGHKSLKIVIDVKKRKCTGECIKTLYTIPYANLLGSDEEALLIHDNVNICIPIKHMNAIHNALGFSKPFALFHIVYMIEHMIFLPADERERIYERVTELVYKKLPTSTAGGQVSHEEASRFLSLLREAVI